MSREINIIAALSDNRVIGKEGKLPWKIKDDIGHFKEVTTGNIVIMGRKTFESIGRPLPNRVNIVVTRDTNFSADGCVIVHSLDEALLVAGQQESGEVFVIGGGEIYGQVMGKADRLVLTVVRGQFDGDTFFPDYSRFSRVVSSEEREQGEYKFTFLVLEK